MAQEANRRGDWHAVAASLQDGDVVMALETFETLLQRGGEPPPELVREVALAQVSRGNDLARRNLWEAALERYRRARELDPRSGEAAFRMGQAFRVLETSGAALACFREAQSLLSSPQDQYSTHHLADAFFQEGIILQEQGKLRAARKAFLQALEVKPDYVEVERSLEELLAGTQRSGGGSAGTDRELLAELMEALASVEPERRREAMAAIRDFPEFAESRAAAARLADGDPDPDVRFEARRTLGSLPRPEEQGPPVSIAGPEGAPDPARLANALRDPNPAVRRKALFLASREPSPEMAPALCAHLRQEDDAFALAQTVALLARTGDASHAPDLEPFLSHASCRVVANAVEAIAELAGEVPVYLLVSLLESEDNRVRANALLGTLHTRRPAILRHLKKMSASAKESMRASALYCMQRVDGDEVERMAFEMLQRETSPELLWKIGTLLARIATDRIRPELETMRQEDADRQGYAVYLLQALDERARREPGV